MTEETEEFWTPTMELRWLDTYLKNSMINEPIRHTLQQKWVSGDGTANNPFKAEWRNVPTYTEET